MPEESTAGYLLHYFPKNIPFSGLCDSPADYVVDVDYKGSGFASDGVAYRASFSSNSFSIGYGLIQKSAFIAVSGLEQQQNYIFYKHGADSCGTFVNTVRPADAGVNNAKGNTLVTISPNPASDHIDIVSGAPLSSDASIKVIDVTGRCIFLSTTNLNTSTTINSANWPDGLYLVIIQNNGGILKKEKVVIAR
jgi:hypothetical protein